MIWIVSKSIIQSEKELDNRQQYIKDVTQAEVSHWSVSKGKADKLFQPETEFYQCISKKGEYGIVITAHINEVSAILNAVLSRKKALIVINSCAISNKNKTSFLKLIKNRNVNSELFFAKQEKTNDGYDLNYVDYVGTFGFHTTQSERELFQHRRLGLTKALRMVFGKVTE